MSTALAEQPKETTPEKKAPIQIEGGLVKCQNLDEAYRFANMVLRSGLAPTSFKTPEAILLAMQFGAEIGLKPASSLQNIAVINGRPGLWGKALPGVVLPTGLLEVFDEWIEGEGDNLTACCKVKRKGVARERIERFSVADAKRAGLWGKNTWALYPKDMLKYKARARAFVLFADVLCGLPVLEDIAEVPPAKTEIRQIRNDAKPDPLLKEVGAEVIDTTPEPAIEPEKKSEVSESLLPLDPEQAKAEELEEKRRQQLETKK